MPVREREIDRGGGMVYGGAQPTVKRVARVAGLRELTGHVVRTLGLLKITHVAGVACRRQTLKLSHGRAFVAIVALHSRVSAQERKTILVILHLLDGDIPALDRMALRAISAHLSLVNVSVTILAILTNRGEDRFGVALRALHLFVHAAQRILGLIVVELRNCSDGTPACRGMAVLAGNIQGTVRTSGGLPLGQWYGSIRRVPRKEQEPAQSLNDRMRNCPLNCRFPRSVILGWGAVVKTYS